MTNARVRRPYPSAPGSTRFRRAFRLAWALPLMPLFVVGVLCMERSASAAEAAPMSMQDGQTEMHWAQRLGLRTLARENATPIVDQVVLVPDAATYLDEIGRWSRLSRWPVLIEDARYAPMFVRAFKPQRVVRRASVEGQLPRGDALQRRLVETALRAWDEPPPPSLDLGTLIERYEQLLVGLGDAPPGIVLAVPGDSAWTAAIALAAGRGLPLRWFGGTIGRTSETMARERVGDLQRQVIGILDDLGLPWRGLGDAIETICVCGDLPVRAQFAAAGATAAPGIVATTDVLGRLPDDSRGAWTGWIFGSEVRSAYVAMCSMFLPRSSALLFNSYGSGEPWIQYSTTPGRAILEEAGFETSERTGPSATAEMWQRSLSGGWSHDLLLMNSSGNADFFNVANAQRRYHMDVPILTRPMAAYFIHSWSFRSPPTRASVGGRFLDNGVYAFVGSVEEPGLVAFLPPRLLAPRIAGAVPLLVAARWWEGGNARPWRVATYGDPLMTFVPPQRDRRRRVPPPGDLAEGAVDLRADVRRLMAEASEGRSADALALAIRGATLLGEDRIAAGLFKAGRAQGFAGSEAARAALVSLFILNDPEEFVEAWLESEPTHGSARDMAWHLLLPRVDADDPRIALLLESALRPPRMDLDAIRLYRRLIEVVGRDAARAFMNRAIERMTDDAQARRLRDELRR